MARIERLKSLYGPGGKLGVGKTQFFLNYIDNGRDKTIPGTDVPRLRLVQLGKRAKGAFEDETDALLEGLRRWRDRNSTEPKQPRALRAAVARRRGGAS